MANDRIRLSKSKLDPWDEFKRALSESIQAIEGRYFYLDRYEAPGAWRERIYCYELYHQMRFRLPKEFPYTFHGEIDKNGHATICQYFPKGAPNPDFVLHIPDTDKNLAVLEVKRGNADINDIKDDIEKLRIFTESVGYEHGLLLFFGPGRDWRSLTVGDKTAVLWHGQVQSRPHVIIGNREEWEF